MGRATDRASGRAREMLLKPARGRRLGRQFDCFCSGSRPLWRSLPADIVRVSVCRYCCENREISKRRKANGQESTGNTPRALATVSRRLFANLRPFSLCPVHLVRSFWPPALQSLFLLLLCHQNELPSSRWKEIWRQNCKRMAPVARARGTR